MKKSSLSIITLLAGFIFLAGCTTGQDTTLTTQQQTTPQTVQSNQPIQSTTAQSQDVIYVDVREDYERDAGHVSGALHVPLGDIQAGKIDTLPKDKTLIIYCRSGNRSNQAIQSLKAQGFTNLVDGGAMTSLGNVQIIK